MSDYQALDYRIPKSGSASSVNEVWEIQHGLFEGPIRVSSYLHLDFERNGNERKVDV
jgi:hypothetical protein